MWSSIVTAAELRAGARTIEQVRRVGHRLHAAGDDDVGRAGLDQIVREHHGLHARAAHLVDGRGAGGGGDLRADGGLARGRLAEAGGQHAAHDHVVDLVGRDARMVERARDRGGAEGRGGNAGELAQQGADGGALGTDDDDVGHEEDSREVRPARWCRVGPDSRSVCCSAANLTVCVRISRRTTPARSTSCGSRWSPRRSRRAWRRAGSGPSRTR